ncbi:MAG: DUF1425 domain-containing protein [Kiritimatiellae bacterium]|nr:DUF1425 domain-containing protein [Kiritimatiellia bacterium]
MNATKTLAAACAAAAMFAGCQSPVTSGMHANVLVDGDVAINASLTTDNSGVGRHVALVGVTTYQLGNGLLKVQARLASNDHRDYAVQYKFRWYDAHGMEIASHTRPWLPLTIHGGEVVQPEGVSPTAGVTAVVIEVRKL